MTKWWKHRRLRIHLTMWYVSAMVVVLGVYAASVFGFVSRRASAALDSRVRADYIWASEMWDRREDGSLTWYDPAGLPDEDSPWLQIWSTGRRSAVCHVRRTAQSGSGEPRARTARRPDKLCPWARRRRIAS